ncbi:TRAP transporter large permease [Falsiroseomonas stagni]|uniref:TRAP transporter large permease protein n=1 Tax=Falsiroseomonas stagni DSM 19981 TaxID=1123062 RepID=A0A1I4A241_9PROT|nr:TRAP transporter large permease subunit [Falsiroseomonas stagni]SFK50393.1 TRAP transporter, DctM subunit [Falsiroseomonas stagni DSM 19981]
MIWTTLLGMLTATVLSGAVLGAALGLTGFAILHFFAGGSTRIGVQTVWNTLNEFTLTAIPLFILLGELLVASGLARGVYRAMAPFFGRLPGGLLHTNIAVCTIFGAVSGSSMSVAAAVGSVAYPELKSRGYDKAQTVGTLAAGGTLGLLIPPSLSLLIYGALTDTSIGRLFIAGVLPGLMMAGLFMAWIVFAALRNPAIAPEEKRVAIAEALRGLPAVLPLLVLIVAVLGSLFAGLATPTEAAGVGVAAAAILGFTIGDLTLRGVGQSLVNTVRTFAVIAMVFVGALVLAQAISLLGLPQQMLAVVSEWGLSKWLLLLVVVVVYLILGCFFDGLSMMIMTLPLVFPLLTGVGFDPVWLGVVVTIMIEVGMLTPPVGMNLFVLVGITGGEVKLGEAAVAALPYWIALLLGVLILCFFPGIALFLPSLAFG